VRAVLILLAVLSGFILSRLGLPASFLTGPLLAAAMFAVTNRPIIRFPLVIYRLARSVIGVMLSFTITGKSLETIAANWAPWWACVSGSRPAPWWYRQSSPLLREFLEYQRLRGHP
jgi:uncharacterized protein